MIFNYRIDEGQIFQYEDYFFYAKWKIIDLLHNGWTFSEIYNFKDDKSWHYFVKNYFDDASHI